MSSCSYCLGLGCQLCPVPLHPGGIGDPTEEELEIHVLRTERDLLREQLDAALQRVAELEAERVRTAPAVTPKGMDLLGDSETAPAGPKNFAQKNTERTSREPVNTDREATTEGGK